MKFQILVLILVSVGSFCDEESTNTFHATKFIQPNSPLHVTIICNDVDLPSTLNVELRFKSRSSSKNFEYLVSKQVLSFPHHPVDVTLDLGEIIEGTYELTIERKGEIIYEQLSFFSTTPSKRVMVKRLQPIYFTEGVGLWKISVHDEVANPVYLVMSDIKLFIRDKNGHNFPVDVQDMYYDGPVMILGVYLNYNIIPDSYEMMVVYNNTYYGLDRFEVFEYKPQPFLVDLSVDFKKRDASVSVNIEVVTIKLDGDIIAGDLTVEFKNHPDFSRTIPISGSEKFSFDMDANLELPLDIKATVRDKQTGEISFTKYYNDEAVIPTIERENSDKRFSIGVPYIGQFSISGLDEYQVRKLNESVIFTYSYANSKEKTFKKEFKAGKFLYDKHFVVVVDHLFTEKSDVSYTIEYAGAIYQSELIYNWKPEPVYLRARQIYGDERGNFKIYCSEPMDRISYVLTTLYSSVTLRSGTLKVNHEMVKTIQIDVDQSDVILFYYFSQNHTKQASYSILLTRDEYFDDSFNVVYKIQTNQYTDIIAKTTTHLKTLPYGVTIAFDHQLQKIASIPPRYYDILFEDRVFRQPLAGEYGIAGVAVPYHKSPKSMVATISKIGQDAVYDLVSYTINYQGMKKILNSDQSIEFRWMFPFKVVAPEKLYLGEVCDIKIIVSNNGDDTSVLKLVVGVSPQNEPHEIHYLLNKKDTTVIVTTVNAEELGVLNVTVWNQLDYHRSPKVFTTTILVEQPPIVSNDYCFTNTSVGTFTKNDENEFQFGQNLLDHLIDQSIRNAEDDFSRLSLEITKKIFQHVESSRLDNDFDRLVIKVIGDLNRDGLHDIWQTAQIVRLILVGDAKGLIGIDKSRLDRSIDSVIAGRNETATSLKIYQMTGQRDLVQQALIVMMLYESSSSRFENHILIHTVLKKFVNTWNSTDDQIAKVLMIHVLVFYGSIEFSSEEINYPDQEVLFNALMQMTRAENESIWLEISQTDLLSAEEQLLANLELTSYAKLAADKFQIKPWSNYLLSNYNRKVPLIYFEALLTGPGPSSVEQFEDSQGSKWYKLQSGGVFAINKSQIEEKYDTQVNVEIKDHENSIEVCVSDTSEKPRVIIVELYLPSGFYVDSANVHKYEVEAKAEPNCRISTLNQKFTVLRQQLWLPVVVYEMNFKEKRNIYYHDYTKIVALSE